MKKYTPVFGPQELFDNAPEHVEVIRFNDYSRDYLWADLNTVKTLTFRDLKAIPIIAMRIIEETPEPKRWTWEDKKAGRLPEVGSKAVSVHGFCVVDILAVRNGCVVACNSDVIDSRPCVFTIDNFLELYKPIESPEEKAQRLEDEWVEKAYDDLLAHIGIHSTESPDFVKQNLHRVYNALLSGELQAPKGE